MEKAYSPAFRNRKYVARLSLLPHLGLLRTGSMVDTIGKSARPNQLRQYGTFLNGETLTSASIVGTETVISSEGTCTPVVSAGTITFDAGTCWDIVLSNGSTYSHPTKTGAAAGIWFDRSGAGIHLTVNVADIDAHVTEAIAQGSNTLELQGWTEGESDGVDHRTGSIAVGANLTEDVANTTISCLVAGVSAPDNRAVIAVDIANAQSIASISFECLVAGDIRIYNGVSYGDALTLTPGTYTYTADVSASVVYLLLQTVGVKLTNITVEWLPQGKIPLRSDLSVSCLNQTPTYTGRAKYSLTQKNAPCATFDGTAGDYISIAGLTGSETVISSGGTSTPSISAGKIDFTAGTCWYLQLSNGMIFPLSETEGTTVYGYDSEGNTYTGTVTASDEGAYHANKQDSFFHDFDYGFGEAENRLDYTDISNAAWIKRGTCTVTKVTDVDPPTGINADVFLIEGLQYSITAGDIYIAVLTSLTPGSGFVPEMYLKLISSSAGFKVGHPSASNLYGQTTVSAGDMGDDWVKLSEVGTIDYPWIVSSDNKVGLIIKSQVDDNAALYVCAPQICAGTEIKQYANTEGSIVIGRQPANPYTGLSCLGQSLTTQPYQLTANDWSFPATGELRDADDNILADTGSRFIYDTDGATPLDWSVDDITDVYINNQIFYGKNKVLVYDDAQSGSALDKILRYLSDANTYFSINVISTQVIAGQFSGDVTVYWGDGTSNSYSGTDQSYSHDYGSIGNRVAVVVGNPTKFTMNQSGANVQFDLAGLPASLTYFYCYGSNTISGDLVDLPAGLTNFLCEGSNTVSGDLADLPAGLTYFRCFGFNTVSGDLADLPTGLTYFICSGSNTISDYSGKTWADNQRKVQLIPVAPGGLSSGEVDNLLIDLDSAGGTWTSDKAIVLTGTNAARTTASDAAVASLIAKGVTVTTN